MNYTGGTGVLIDNANLETNFKEFLSFSKIEYLSKGTFGIVFRATIDPTIIDPSTGYPYTSPFRKMNVNDYGTPITSLIIKFSVIEYKTDAYKDAKLIRTIKEEDFIKEVNVQTETFQKTMEYLQPLCPAMIFAKIQENKQIIKTLNRRIKDKNWKNNLAMLFRAVSKFSIIAMELLENYQTLYSFIKQPIKYNLYQKMTIYLLIMFALKTRYTHADFHAGNIMVNPDDDTYFDGIKGSVILIDFGAVRTIPDDKFEKIKEILFENEKVKNAIEYNLQEENIDELVIENATNGNRYQRIINILCDISRSDGLIPKEYSAYDNVCKFQTDEKYIDYLFIAREKALEKNTNMVATKSGVPMLPLSNKIKNNMYSGILDETTIQTNVITLPIPLTFPESNKANLSLNLFKILIHWACDVVKTILSINKDNFTSAKMCQIYFDACCMSTYLFMNPQLYSNYIPLLKENLQLILIVGLYYAGINDDEKIYKPSKIMGIPLNNNIYNFFTAICDNAYDKNKIMNAINYFEPILTNIHITNVGDFMSYAELELFLKMAHENKKTFLVDMFLEPPKQLIKKTFNTNNSTMGSTNLSPILEEEDYTEFDFPFKNSSDMLGGKKKSRKLKNKKMNKFKKTKKFKKRTSLKRQIK